jgi:hemerythrin
MGIEWSAKLSTGLEWQDKQHRELFNRINSLLDAMNLGLGKNEVVRLFKFLDEYIVIHFDAEEQVMHKFGYPEMLSHLEEHTRFIEDVSNMKDEADEALTSGLVIKVQSRIVDWLINHIGSVDKKLGAFITKESAQRRSSQQA